LFLTVKSRRKKRKTVYGKNFCKPFSKTKTRKSLDPFHFTPLCSHSLLSALCTFSLSALCLCTFSPSRASPATPSHSLLSASALSHRHEPAPPPRQPPRATPSHRSQSRTDPTVAPIARQRPTLPSLHRSASPTVNPHPLCLYLSQIGSDLI
jgi:hypothetical protein